MPPSSGPPADDQLIQPLCAIFRRYLKRLGLKFTPERALLLDVVLAKPGVFEAEDLIADLRHARRHVGKATVYRTLKHLREARIITEVLIDSKHAHYQLSFGREPKGHLVCVETGRIIEFPTGELAELRDRLCAEHGFTPLNHHFVIYGLSPEAQQAAQAEAKAEQKRAEFDAAI